VVTNLGNIAFGLKNYQEAEERYLESLAICQKVGFNFGAFYALDHLGETKIKMGEYEAAKHRFQEALALALSLDSLPLILTVLVDIASLMAAITEIEPAQRLLAYVLNNDSSRQESLNKAEQLWSQIMPGQGQDGVKELGQKSTELGQDKITDFTMQWLNA
jgi:tetratricopeptide (TPR) repeat protein